MNHKRDTFRFIIVWLPFWQIERFEYFVAVVMVLALRSFSCDINFVT